MARQRTICVRSFTLSLLTLISRLSVIRKDFDVGAKSEAIAWSKLQLASSSGHRSVILASQIEQDEMCGRSDAVGRLRSWEQHQWGRVIVGRRGGETRFLVSPRTARSLRNGPSTAVPTQPASARTISGLPGSSTNTKPTLIAHVFKLRHDTEIEVKLPSDITDREASRMARFVEAIPL